MEVCEGRALENRHSMVVRLSMNVGAVVDTPKTELRPSACNIQCIVGYCRLGDGVCTAYVSVLFKEYFEV